MSTSCSGELKSRGQKDPHSLLLLWYSNIAYLWCGRHLQRCVSCVWWSGSGQETPVRGQGTAQTALTHACMSDMSPGRNESTLGNQKLAGNLCEICQVFLSKMNREFGFNLNSWISNYTQHENKFFGGVLNSCIARSTKNTNKMSNQ